MKDSVGYVPGHALRLNGEGHVDTGFREALPEVFTLSMWVRSKSPGVLFSKLVPGDDAAAAGSIEGRIDAEGRPVIKLGDTVLRSEGAITDGGDSAIDIVANNAAVTMLANSGIGAADPIDTQIGSLDASAPFNGNIRIAEVDDITVVGFRFQT